MFDNRELASCHTPRLNAFLVEVAAAVRQAGGTFQVRPDESGKRAIQQANDQSTLTGQRLHDHPMSPKKKLLFA